MGIYLLCIIYKIKIDLFIFIVIAHIIIYIEEKPTQFFYTTLSISLAYNNIVLTITYPLILRISI